MTHHCDTYSEADNRHHRRRDGTLYVRILEAVIVAKVSSLVRRDEEQHAERWSS